MLEISVRENSRTPNKLIIAMRRARVFSVSKRMNKRTYDFNKFVIKFHITEIQ